MDKVATQADVNTIPAWPEDGLEPVSECPVCGSGERSLLYDGLTDRVFRVATGVWTLYRCESCGCAWLDPRPTQDSIGMAYASYYTHDPADQPVVRRKGVLRRFLHDAVNDYRNRRYGLNWGSGHGLGRVIVPLIPPLRAAIDAECRHLPRPPADGGRLLDVGFGNGGFLKLATEMGWNAEGVDFDPKAVAVASARGLNVRCVTAGQLQDEYDKYDVITLSHVIEHVHDPIGLLRSLYRLLKQGGTLWLETPNLDSLGASRYGRSWRGLEPPRHLVLFNAGSLIKVLKGAGFLEVRQVWRGMVVFGIFAQSDAIKSGRPMNLASRGGRPTMGDIIGEVSEMFSRHKREFITLQAVKETLIKSLPEQGTSR